MWRHLIARTYAHTHTHTHTHTHRVTEGNTHIYTHTHCTFQAIRFTKILRANLVDKTFNTFKQIFMTTFSAKWQWILKFLLDKQSHSIITINTFNFIIIIAKLPFFQTSSALSCELTLLANFITVLSHSPCLFINLYCQVFPAKSVLPCVTCYCLNWKSINFAGIKIPPFLLYVIQFFSSASKSGHLQYAYEISISSSLNYFNSSSSRPHSHTIYSAGSAPKCLSATLLAL
jgi:hypothetical protein